jgi:hypothetical protein
VPVDSQPRMTSRPSSSSLLVPVAAAEHVQRPVIHLAGAAVQSRSRISTMTRTSVKHPSAKHQVGRGAHPKLDGLLRRHPEQRGQQPAVEPAHAACAAVRGVIRSELLRRCEGRRGGAAHLLRPARAPPAVPPWTCPAPSPGGVGRASAAPTLDRALAQNALRVFSTCYIIKQTKLALRHSGNRARVDIDSLLASFAGKACPGRVPGPPSDLQLGLDHVDRVDERRA